MNAIIFWVSAGVIGALLFGAPVWLTLAVLAAAILSVLILADAFFFKGEVYGSELEPVVISGFLQLTPWLVIPWFVPIEWSAVMGAAMAAGALNMLAFFFYCRAMDAEQDAVVISVLWNVTIATVPLAAFVLLGERLAAIQYLGIALIAVGATIGAWKRGFVRGRVVRLMVLGIIASTLYSIVMKFAFGDAGGEGGGVLYWRVFLFFTLGEGLVSMAALLAVRWRREIPHLTKIVLKFWPFMLLLELGQVVFSGVSAAAVSRGPVSLVTAVEGLTGVFVILISLAIARLFTRTRFATLTHAMEDTQLMSSRSKLIGIILVVVGAYIATGGV